MEQEQHKPKTAEAPQDRIASLEDASHTLNGFGLTVFIIVIIQIVLMFGLNLYQKSRVASLDESLTELRAKLNSAEYSRLNTQVEEVISGNDKLRVVLASKVKWDTFYTRLNETTPTDVQVKTVNVNSDGTFRADGETTSMTSLAKALVAWNGGVATAQSPFNAVRLNSNSFVSAGEQRRVSFSISGQINMGILR